MNADPANLKVASERKQSGILFSVARQTNSERLYLGAADAKVYSLDVGAKDSQAAEFVGHTSYVTGVALAGRFLVSGSYDGDLIWWDRDSGELVGRVAAHSRGVRRVISSPDGRYVISVADDMRCRIWDVERARLVRDLHGHEQVTPHHFPSMLYACAVSADGQYLATGDRTGKNIVWDLHNGRQLAVVETPVMYTWDPVQRIHSIGGVRSLAFSPDSRLLAVGGMGKVGNIDHLGGLARVEIFDWQAGQRTHEFPGETHKGLVEQLAFHPTGKWLLAAGGDHKGFIQFFDLNAGKVLKQDKAPMHVHDFTLNEVADTIYAAGHGRIVVWTL